MTLLFPTFDLYTVLAVVAVAFVAGAMVGFAARSTNDPS